MNDLTTVNVTMSSREIAELTGKPHGNVMRDIRAMMKALGDDSNLNHLREEKDSRGYTKAAHLDRELTETLITGYSIPLRHRVIRRLHELEEARVPAPPGEFAQGAFKEFQATRLELITTVADMTEQSLRVADLLGFAGNQSRFYADKLVKRQIGIGPMELLGVTSLPGAATEQTFTPKDLGSRFGLSPQAFNQLLAKHGFQEKGPVGETPAWRPTLKGEPHSAYEDTGRQHNGGAPVRTLRWKLSVLDELRQVATQLAPMLRPVTRG
ncbi:Rha family transcriptional regulator [Pseudomonas kuykendallii]|uniref:Rha family transcriptional regulator n=1 Tax=Pseudomonas kuykendallii TaxID=1007099 RepID=UPI0028D42E15|nr:Rha family transcriptional regulator [Pseudomonas kuykendallii]